MDGLHLRLGAVLLGVLHRVVSLWQQDKTLKEGFFFLQAGKMGNLEPKMCGSEVRTTKRTLWLLSPSRLAVVTKHVPSSRDEDRRMRSQGNVSFSFTNITSPTWGEKNAAIRSRLFVSCAFPFTLALLET